jgi:hypothetical protein
METSRRGLLIGGMAAAAVSLIVPAAPAIVRASSLMDIRGELMNPWVLAYRKFYHDDATFAETEHFQNVPMSRWKEIIALPLSIRMQYLGGADDYRILRQSEVKFRRTSRLALSPEEFSSQIFRAKQAAALRAQLVQE